MEHITNTLHEDFRAKSIHGRLVAKELVGWPPAQIGDVQVHGPGGFSKTIAVKSDGTFTLIVATGTYCFKISADGFQSYLGRVIVTPEAEVDQEIRVVIAMGV